jgi:uncharacterized glyoxalase superfamily protein PhnB
MKNPPEGWPRISSALFYDDAAKAIDWLCRSFGFEVRLKVEGEAGRIEHSELVFGGGLVMVGSTHKYDRPDRDFCASPKSLGGKCTQALCVCVDDVDAHCERARAAGAKIVSEPATQDYGEEYWSDRTYQAEDLEGHRWWFMQRVREPRSSAK